MPTLKELKKLATQRKIKGRSKMNKAQLILALGVTAVKKPAKKSRKPSIKKPAKKSRKPSIKKPAKKSRKPKKPKKPSIKKSRKPSIKKPKKPKKPKKSRIKIPKGPNVSPDGSSANSTIDLLRKTEAASTTYSGSILMQEIELLYLIKKYNPCYLIGSLISGFEIDDLTLSWDEKSSMVFEPMGLGEGIEKCRASGKRFSILGITIRGSDGGLHANYLLYDTKANEIERFEPHGKMSSYTGFSMNKAFKDLFAKYGIKYISQFDFCPFYGPQYFSSNYGDVRSGDPGGFCQAWSTYWISARLANPNVSREKLIEYMTTKRKISPAKQGFRTFIRNFSVFLLSEKNKILDEFEARFGYRFPERRPSRAQISDLESILREVILQSHRRNKK